MKYDPSGLKHALAEARAEIERLTKERQAFKGMAKDNYDRLQKAETERDEARAQVAAAYEAAAIRSENYACGAPYNQRASINALANSLRGMTPDDAKAALEAYGREKVREGMKRAVDLYPQGIAAILAEMEKLK